MREMKGSKWIGKICEIVETSGFKQVPYGKLEEYMSKLPTFMLNTDKHVRVYLQKCEQFSAMSDVARVLNYQRGCQTHYEVHLYVNKFRHPEDTATEYDKYIVFKQTFGTLREAHDFLMNVGEGRPVQRCESSRKDSEQGCSCATR